MPRDIYSKYLWILETIKQYGSITRKELAERWLRSPVSEGQPLVRRTFFNYRQAIEEIFNVNICFNSSTNEYSIEETDGNHSMTDWVLNSMAITNVINDSREVADSIFLEEIPSAKEFLSLTITALKERQRLQFTYNSYSRATPTHGIQLEPYFLKLFRQRWYVTGRNVHDKAIKTYALDRITEAHLIPTTYQIPPTFDPQAYAKDSFGIIFNESTPQKVVIRVDARQAKYFRDLPLHTSQTETTADGYSIFTYNLRLTYDFVQELLSHGPSVTVLHPAELRATIRENLSKTLSNYAEPSDSQP